VAGEIDPLRVVNDAIENGVSVGGIADQLVPFVDRDLAGDDRRSPTVAFFENFEEVVAGGGIERVKTPIIEDEQLQNHLPELFEREHRSAPVRLTLICEPITQGTQSSLSKIIIDTIDTTRKRLTTRFPGWPARSAVVSPVGRTRPNRRANGRPCTSAAPNIVRCG
jgi:hypothetical protein